MRYHLTQGVTVVSRTDTAGEAVEIASQQGKSFSQAPGRGQQEMSAAAGRVDDANGQNCLVWINGVCGQPLFDNRFERSSDQFLHQTVGGVVAAGQFAGITCRTGCVGSAHEVE